MKLQVLGCHGGELPKCKTTCFLIDGVLALDAGALTGSLTLDALCRVDDIVVSHSHFDHVKDLPLLADLIVGRRETPVTIHASRECAKTLRDILQPPSHRCDTLSEQAASAPAVASLLAQPAPLGVTRGTGGDAGGWRLA